MALAIPLESLYLYLVSAGFPLSVRDYQDALSALRCGHGLHTREDVLWLCRTLWARTDEEEARLVRLFDEFPRPTSEEIQQLVGEGHRDEHAAPRDATGRFEQRPQAPNVRAIDGEESPTVEFVPPSQSGVGLPRAMFPQRRSETFIFTPRPLVSLRALTIAWRRYRIAQRSGPKTELDIDATVAEQCRRGTLVEPVLVSARRNQARLTVLVDSSPSMVTWTYTTRLLVESLDRSQLGHSSAYFFDNMPDDVLYEAGAHTPMPLKTVRDESARSAVVVISDAGAARGGINRERVRQVREFLAASQQSWQPVAWLNPMPRARWSQTTAAQIARLHGLSMFELTDDGLIMAVDYLRGKRVA